jgi:hypothetical protein
MEVLQPIRARFLQLLIHKEFLMLWFFKNKRYWRIAFLLLLALAISGPWWFDRIDVPAPFPCSAPIIRLDEDFCGSPMSVTWFYSSFIAEIRSLVRGVPTNALSPDDAAREMLINAWVALPLLPLLTTVLVLLQGDHRGAYLFHLVVLGTAAVLIGLIGILGFSRASWVLWGLWLYIGLTISVLLLEIRLFKVNRSLTHE